MEQTKERITSICFAAGHSGGHIIPCLTLAERYKRAHPHTSVLFFSSSNTMDQTILRKSTLVNMQSILTISQQRSWYRLPLLGAQLLWAMVKAWYLLAQHKPSRIISTGGIIAVPVSLAGWLLRIPIDLYELNAIPGSATQVVAPVATTLYICFASTKKYFPKNNCLVTPYPIRFDIKDVVPGQLPSPFTPDRLTMFVQGGSQGSQGINRLIKQLIEGYPDLQKRIQLIHQTGPDSIDWHTFYKKHKIPARVFAYDHDMVGYYQQADLILCRAGAGALFESLFFRKPCITIPLETKRNTHQLDNAHAMIAEYPEFFTMIRQGEGAVDEIYKYICRVLMYPQKKEPI